MDSSGQVPLQQALPSANPIPGGSVAPVNAAAVLNWAAVSGAAHPVNEIATIGDRKVRVAGGSVALAAATGSEPSLYSLCRQWVQNNPNIILPSAIEDVPQLPPVQKQADAVSAAPFDGSLVIPDDGDPTSLEAHKQRWKAAADHMRQTARQSRQPYLQRLMSAVPGGHSGMS